jgi:hypothetical protein
MRLSPKFGPQVSGFQELSHGTVGTNARSEALTAEVPERDGLGELDKAQL